MAPALIRACGVAPVAVARLADSRPTAASSDSRRPAYGKLAMLHRRNAPPEEASPPPTAEQLAEAPEAPEAAEQDAVRAAAVAGGGKRAAAEEEEDDDDNDDDEGPAGEGIGGGGEERKALHLRLFAMLLRYKSLQGHGYQAAIGEPVWNVLRQRLGVACEGFASPLNAYLPAFGSAFPELDGVFGSRGSFFSLEVTSL